jgi:hypothetical protein
MQRAAAYNLIRKIGTTCLPAFSLSLLCYLAGAGSAHATSADFSTVAANITSSASRLPGLLTALAYGLGLMLGVSGIIKLKEHVETPNQAPMRSGLVRLFVGGALFALPIVYEAMTNTIGNNGMFAVDSANSGLTTGWALLLGNGGAINDVLKNIMNSTQFIPGLFTAVAYLIGILAGVAGLLKIREHVETPDQVQLKEPVIRLLTGGAMFALPTIMQAAQQTIDGNSMSGFTGLFDLVATMVMPSAVRNANAGAGGVGGCIASAYSYGSLFSGAPAGGVGDTICTAVNNTSYMPGILTGMAYLFGIVLVIWGVMKIKDNVLNPQQTSIWEGLSRLIAGGSFFAMPYLIGVVANTLDGGGGLLAALSGFTNSGFNGATTGSGLDAMMVNFTADMFGPMLFALNFFGYVTGAVLLMVGISRLLKSAQEGPRGPGGIGTIMTFLAAGAMLSMSPMIGAFSQTFFASDTAATQATLVYSTGMNTAEVQHVQAVVSAILQFMIVLGVVAFLRGIYIIREVAEGNSQASIMAGITHMVGGALAVNLGPVMNAIQTTLGLTGYGVNFI